MKSRLLILSCFAALPAIAAETAPAVMQPKPSEIPATVAPPAAPVAETPAASVKPAARKVPAKVHRAKTKAKKHGSAKKVHKRRV